MLVISDVQVQHTTASMTGEMLADLVCEQGDTGVLNGDFVKWLETVYNAERGAIFLDNTKLSRSVGGVGGFINSSFKLALDEFTDFFVYSRQYRNVRLHPGLVQNCWDLDGWKEVFMEVALFGVTPRESFILDTHEMVHQRAFFWQ